MESQADPPKNSLQPKLWLLGTAVFVGVGAGLLAITQQPAGEPFEPWQGPAFFAVVPVVQAVVGWMLLRAGDNPKDSVLADLMQSQARGQGFQIEPKPLLWMAAFVLFALAALFSTMFVGMVI